MRLGIYFDGFAPASEMIEISRRAEAAGADSLWFAQHVGYREALIMAGAVAGVTRTIKLVPTAVTPDLWRSLPTAMSLATLDELARGRIMVAVSVGNLLNLSESGIEAAKPVRVINEYVHTIRAHLAGGSVHFAGELETLRGSHMEFGKDARIPIYVASTGPQVLNLAGRVGDGVLLSAGLTLESCRRCLAAADAGAKAAGRDPAAVRKAGFINFNVSRDGKAAKAALLRKLAFLFRSRGHAENIKSSGLNIDHKSIMDALSRRDLDAAARLLPEEAASVFGVAGTPDECGELLERYLSLGLTEPVIEISGQGEDRKLALEVLRDLATR
jgi:5,10-methylenetetrahydromethanopterin reductase